MVAYYMTHYMHIACVYMLKSFYTLSINNNNYLCSDIIVYKLNLFINISSNPNLDNIPIILSIKI